jgi:predicted dehydrogenase
VEIGAFCAAHEESAKAAAVEFGAASWSADYRRITENPDLDGVIVASPDRFHCEQVVAAAQAGKHVLCEKPMCRDIEEADRMIDAARERSVVLMVGFTERYNHPCMDAKARIARGEIGKPRMILARRCHPRSIVRGRKWLNDAETGGVLNYAGTHNIDLICWLMGAQPDRIYAEMGQLILAGQDFTDCAVMTFRFRDSGVAVLYETFAYPSPYPQGVDRSIEVLGDKGVLHIDFLSQPLKAYTENGYSVGDAVTWPSFEGHIEGALLNELRHFIGCVRSSGRPDTGGEEGKLAIRIANAAREAAHSGQAVYL